MKVNEDHQGFVCSSNEDDLEGRLASGPGPVLVSMPRIETGLSVCKGGEASADHQSGADHGERAHLQERLERPLDGQSLQADCAG